MNSALAPRKHVYRHGYLKRLLSPTSVAVMGASARPGSFGQRTVEALRYFKGGVYPINPKYEEICGRKAYPSIASLPEKPDCVFIAANRDLVQDMVEQAIAAGAGGIVIFASGYIETGDPRYIAMQEKLTQTARASGVPIIGPNCMGLKNYTIEFYGSFSEISVPPYPAGETGVGIVSQSGALGVSLWQSVNAGMTLSHLLSSGNSCDVDAADFISYLAEEPKCKAIGCLFEGISSPERLMEAARIAWANDKPLILYRAATREQSAQAAMSHTGSLAGSNEAFEAAFEDVGIVPVDDIEALLETTRLFAKAPKGDLAEGVAIVSASGGAGVICADKAEKHAVPLPQPSPASARVLEAHIPAFGSTRNPTDVTAQVMTDPESLSKVCRALLEDDRYGAIMMAQVTAVARTIPRVAMLGDLARDHGKLACIVWMSQWPEGPGSLEAERHDHVALFRSPERCFAALAAWHHRNRKRAAVDAKQVRLSPIAAGDKARAVIVQAAKGSALTERESKEILAFYGIGVTREMLAGSKEEAGRLCDELGFPLVMKAESPDIPHKTEAGVIRLNLRSKHEALVAYDEIMANARRVVPPARINGILVQQMVPRGLEIMVGARHMPEFGHLIVVSLGGVFVELLKDSASALAPVTRDKAMSMLAALKAQRALDGFRGEQAVDREKLAEVLVRVSEMTTDLGGQLAELDVNPLLCSGGSIVAVDALVVARPDHDGLRAEA